MKLTIEQILKRLGRNAVLRPGEKESLRTFLLGHIHSRPPAPAAHSFSFFSFFFSRGLAAAAVFLAVLGSVAAGAERALPGSPLYGVKISLNENVRGWFALSTEAEARWEARKAERRLKEGVALSVGSALSRERGSEIEERFEKHVRNFSAKVAEIEKKEKKAAAKVQSEADISLKAHEKVLKQLGKMDREAEALAREAESKRGAVSEDSPRQDSAAPSSLSVPPSASEEIKELAEKSESAIAEAEKIITAGASRSPEPVLSEAVFELNRAKEKRAAGLRQRELGDRAGASARFTEARDIALEAKEVFSLKLELRLDFGTTTP